MEDRKFRKSDHDDCLFTNVTVIVLFWVDDCIFYSKDTKYIDDMIYNLKDIFLLEREEDVARFIGLKFDRDNEKGNIALTQTGLINMILDATGMDDSNPKYISVEKDLLYKDEQGEQCCKEWNYRSVV